MVQEALLHFLFESKGSMYDGKGFEMLDALNQHCCPDSGTNAFTTLLSLFNDNMGETEEIMAFCSCFDRMVTNMAQCKIVIPPILMVIFSFICYILATMTCWSNFFPLQVSQGRLRQFDCGGHTLPQQI